MISSMLEPASRFSKTVATGILVPRNTWADPAAYDATARMLGGLFRANFQAYEAGASPEVRAAGPVV